WPSCPFNFSAVHYIPSCSKFIKRERWSAANSLRGSTSPPPATSLPGAVAASAQHPLPERRRLLSYRLKGQRSDRVECRGGIVYHTNFQLEPVAPELFWTFQ